MFKINVRHLNGKTTFAASAVYNSLWYNKTTENEKLHSLNLPQTFYMCVKSTHSCHIEYRYTSVWIAQLILRNTFTKHLVLIIKPSKKSIILRFCIRVIIWQFFVKYANVPPLCHTYLVAVFLFSQRSHWFEISICHLSNGNKDKLYRWSWVKLCKIG